MRLSVIILIFISIPTFGQFSTVKRVLDNLQDGDYSKARELLIKAIERDSLDPGIQYAFSLLYDAPNYERANPDSAYYFIQTARNVYSALDSKALDRLKRSGVDSLMLEHQKLLLDSQAFERALAKNTVEGYQEFMLKYPTSMQYQIAIPKEEEAAYKIATEKGSYQAYEYFMETYPKAVQVPEALARFELLYFQSMTENGKLDSYTNFLSRRPDSPYRTIAEEKIAEIATAGNKLIDIKSTMGSIRSEQVRSKLINLTYHVLKETGELHLFEDSWYSDSLRQVSRMKNDPLFVVIQEDGYGFVDSLGQLITKLPMDSIYSTYLCGPIESDVIILMNTVDFIVKDRNWNSIWQGRIDAIEDIGYGLLKMTHNDLAGVLHKTGVEILPTIYEDVKQLYGSFVATKKNGRWGIVSYMGRQVVPNAYDAIESLNGSILIYKDGKIAITNVNGLKKGADGFEPDLIFLYDEIEPWPDEKIWVMSGKKEGLINNESSFDIPLGGQKIVPSKKEYLVYGIPNRYLNEKFELIAENWSSVEMNEIFTKVTIDSKDFLLSKPQNELVPYDSIELWGNHFAIVKNNNDLQVVFQNLKLQQLTPEEESIGLINTSEAEYLVITVEDKKTVYSSKGVQLISGNYDEIKALGKEYLTVKSKGQVGLYSSKGDRLLPTEYDAFGGYSNGGISVLKKGKLGYYHNSDSVLIPPTLERKVVDSQNGWYVVYREGANQIINKEGVNKSGFSFKEVFPWNDSTFIVRREDGFALFRPKDGSFAMEGLLEVKFNKKSDLGIEVRSGEGWGIIHPKKNVIVPPIYTFLTQMGTLIRAEKYIKDLDFYLIAYYNAKGQRVFRQGLIPDQYDKLFCDN